MIESAPRNIRSDRSPICLPKCSASCSDQARLASNRNVDGRGQCQPHLLDQSCALVGSPHGGSHFQLDGAKTMRRTSRWRTHRTSARRSDQQAVHRNAPGLTGTRLFDRLETANAVTGQRNGGPCRQAAITSSRDSRLKPGNGDASPQRVPVAASQNNNPVRS